MYHFPWNLSWPEANIPQLRKFVPLPVATNKGLMAGVCSRSLLLFSLLTSVCPHATAFV